MKIYDFIKGSEIQLPSLCRASGENTVASSFLRSSQNNGELIAKHMAALVKLQEREENQTGTAISG